MSGVCKMFSRWFAPRCVPVRCALPSSLAAPLPGIPGIAPCTAPCRWTPASSSLPARGFATEMRRNFFDPVLDRPGIMLGIESTCDESGVSFVDEHGIVLGNVTASQHAQNQKYGGVVPHLAARMHRRNLPVIFDSLLEKSGVNMSDVVAIALATGPGLTPCLDEGRYFAMELARKHNKHIVPVHHLEGHILAAQLDRPDITFPCMALVVSGGHTQMVFINRPGDYVVVGSTQDDAVGEAFDKTARLLGLLKEEHSMSLPAGAILEERAANGDPTVFPLPVAMRVRPGADFSFAGLKTAVLREVDTLREARIDADSLTNRQINNIAASFQRAACQQISERVERSLFWARNKNVHQLILCGGVANNNELQASVQRACSEFGIECITPTGFCEDNGAMIAWAGGMRLALDPTVGIQVPPPTPEETEVIEAREAAAGLPEPEHKPKENTNFIPQTSGMDEAEIARERAARNCRNDVVPIHSRWLLGPSVVNMKVTSKAVRRHKLRMQTERESKAF